MGDPVRVPCVSLILETDPWEPRDCRAPDPPPAISGWFTIYIYTISFALHLPYRLIFLTYSVAILIIYKVTDICHTLKKIKKKKEKKIVLKRTLHYQDYNRKKI